MSIVRRSTILLLIIRDINLIKSNNYGNVNLLLFSLSVVLTLFCFDVSMKCLLFFMLKIVNVINEFLLKSLKTKFKP